MCHPDNFSDVAFAERYERPEAQEDGVDPMLQPIEDAISALERRLERDYFGKPRDDEYWKLKKMIAASDKAVREIEVNCFN